MTDKEFAALQLRLYWLLSRKQTVLLHGEQMVKHGDGFTYDVVGMCELYDAEIQPLLEKMEKAIAQ